MRIDVFKNVPDYSGLLGGDGPSGFNFYSGYDSTSATFGWEMGTDGGWRYMRARSVRGDGLVIDHGTVSAWCYSNGRGYMRSVMQGLANVTDCVIAAMGTRAE